MTDFSVSVSFEETVNTIKKAVVNGSITGTLVDEYRNGDIVVMVFDKHYYRAGNRLTLTVTVDVREGKTHVHAVGGGGGEGLFCFDWGASNSFEDCVTNALRMYKLR